MMHSSLIILQRQIKAQDPVSKSKPHQYKPGNKLWFNNSLFRDAYSKSQKSNKLSSMRFRLFQVLETVGKIP